MLSNDHLLGLMLNAGFSVIDVQQLQNFRNFASMINNKEIQRLREENRRLSLLLKRIQILVNDAKA